MDDFHDITEPTGFLPEPSTPWWLWLTAAAICLPVLAVIWYFLSKARAHKQNATLLDKARKSLSRLRSESSKLPAHSVAVKISMIIRRYLANAFDDPAIFETNEEFILRESALDQLHPDSREPVSQFLTKLSNIKYAPDSTDIPNEASTQITQLLDQAEELIANIEINVGSIDD